MRIDQISRKYFGVQCSGGNQKGRIKAICLHSTEGSTAAGAAAYLHGRPDGSVHIVVDDDEAYRLANDSTITCGAGGYNTGVVHIEQAGFAHWSRRQWLRRTKTLVRASYWTAVELRKHDLKPRVLRSRSELERGGGYTFHYLVTKAGYPTTHTDPGPHYPELRVRLMIRFFYHHPKAKEYQR